MKARYSGDASVIIVPMCDIVRKVPQTLGERMLGGGDKGAAGALVPAGGAAALKKAVETAYPRSRPDFADKLIKGSRNQFLPFPASFFSRVEV